MGLMLLAPSRRVLTSSFVSVVILGYFTVGLEVILPDFYFGAIWDLFWTLFEGILGLFGAILGLF